MERQRDIQQYIIGGIEVVSDSGNMYMVKKGLERGERGDFVTFARQCTCEDPQTYRLWLDDVGEAVEKEKVKRVQIENIGTRSGEVMEIHINDAYKIIEGAGGSVEE